MKTSTIYKVIKVKNKIIHSKHKEAFELKSGKVFLSGCILMQPHII